MSDADGLAPLRDVVARFEIAPKKTLGQNFLFDLNLTRKIARAAGRLDDCDVVEIGPGPGGLTRALLTEGARHVFAIERDERCIAALEEIGAHYQGRLSIINADALEIDPKTLGDGVGPLKIVANLPYNIGTALLARWLEAEPWPPRYTTMILMFQREVALRLVATPRQRADYGRLAVLANWRCTTQLLFDVAPSAFTPPPKVTSSVVALEARAQPLPCALSALSALTKAAFGQRRKMLRQALKSLSGTASGFDVMHLLQEAGIAPTARAEEIELEGFVRMAQVYEAMRRG